MSLSRQVLPRTPPQDALGAAMRIGFGSPPIHPHRGAPD